MTWDLEAARALRLLAYSIKFANQTASSLHEILHILQLNLFDRRPIMALLNPKPPAHKDVKPNSP